jgi:hypothetical protein
MAGHGSLIQNYWLHPRAWNQRKLHAQNLPVCKAACKVVVAKESDWPFEKCEEKKNTRCFGDTDTVWFFLLWSIVLSLVRDFWVLLYIYMIIYHLDYILQISKCQSIESSYSNCVWKPPLWKLQVMASIFHWLLWQLSGGMDQSRPLVDALDHSGCNVF